MDFLTKIKSFLPSTWSEYTGPLGVALVGHATVAGEVDSAIQQVAPQLRIRTATGGVLDLVAGDFFGVNLPRLAGELDIDYRNRILVTLFREQGTYKAMRDAIGYFTGYYPVIKERGVAITAAGYTVTSGSDDAGTYGGVVKPRHCFIDVYMVTTQPVANIGGYGSPVTGYGAGQSQYISKPSNDLGGLFQLINSVKPVGTKVWVRDIIGDNNTLVNSYGAIPIPTGALMDAYGGLLSDKMNTIITDNTGA